MAGGGTASVGTTAAAGDCADVSETFPACLLPFRFAAVPSVAFYRNKKMQILIAN